MWRTHDVLRAVLNSAKTEIPIKGHARCLMVKSKAGTPIPAIVAAADYRYGSAALADLHRQRTDRFRNSGRARSDRKQCEGESGFPFFIPGVAGARAPHPPLDFAPDESVALWMVACRATS